MSRLTADLVGLADKVATGLAAHRAVVRTFGDTVDYRAGFGLRAERAALEIAAQIKKLADDVEKAAATIASGDVAVNHADRKLVADAAGAEGDLRRHLAAILDYLGQPDAAAAELGMAVRLYRPLDGDDSAAASAPVLPLTDRYGLAVASFTWGTVLRRIGRLPEATAALDQTVDALEGSGFDFATGIIACERALIAASDGSDDPVAMLEAEAASLRARRLPREAAYVDGTLACLVAATAPADAQRLLGQALRAFDPDEYPPGTEVEQLLDAAVADYRRGRVHAEHEEHEDALRALGEAVRTIQRVPVGWYQATHRGDPFHEPFQRIYTEAVRSCRDVSGPTSARQALRLIETARRSSLAGFLRQEVRSVYPTDDVRADRLVDHMLDELVTLSGAELQSTRADLGEQLPETFVDAFLPPPIDDETIQEAVASLGGRHGLITLITSVGVAHAEGVVVWIAPGGDPVIHGFELDSRHIGFVNRLRDDGILPAACSAAGDDVVMWEDLGRRLLPQGLRDELLASPPESPPELVLCPDGILSYIPWPAVMIDGRTRLVERADLALVPSFTLLGDGRLALHAGTALAMVALVPDARGRDLFLGRGTLERAWSEAEASGAMRAIALDGTRTGLREALDGARRDATSPLLLYLATHGSGDGRDQEILLRDGPLRADAALLMRWPDIVVLASCHVSRNPASVGVEPFSFPVSCLAGGASVFIAGVHEIEIRRAPELHSALIAGLATRDPVRALADAQRDWLERKGPRTLALWAGLRAYVAG